MEQPGESNNNIPAKGEGTFSLNDDRRERTLSPGAMTAKRFFRNRLAVVGLGILGFMFLFSFLGGALIPYEQDQVFYRDEMQRKEYAGVTVNDAFQFQAAPGQEMNAVLQAQMTLNMGRADSFSYKDTTYNIRREGTDLYSLYAGDVLVGIAHKDIMEPVAGGVPDFGLLYAALTAYTNGQKAFQWQAEDYTLEDGSVFADGQEIAHISRLIIRTKTDSQSIPRPLRALVEEAVTRGYDGFVYTPEGGQEQQFSLVYDPANRLYSLRQSIATRVWDAYASPSVRHPLGTDKNGMDMLTRLMYGGRVSLVIGFIVVLISGVLGVVLGGVAGYFGRWVDGLVMRIVDIFYCIPSTPLLIILGAAMDGMRVDPRIRMLYLMLILGLLGWPGIARLVRGQILSLREQEFMTAAEAGGLSAPRRIFRHLIPNVIPQLIVICTMSLGSTIITEATLSFLGLGVKFPFASWGNIMNDVSNAHVLTSYWFVWIPAGVCLVLSVLGFNFVGDGLRDAFDPKMKR